MKKWVAFAAILLAGHVGWGAAEAESPCELKFGRVAGRRFALDNELVLCERAEAASVEGDALYPMLGKDLRLVGGFWPAAHYRIRVTGPSAAIVFTDAAGEEKLRFDAPAEEVPPYDFSILLTGAHRPAAFVSRAGGTRLIGIGDLPKGVDIREKTNLTRWKFCTAGACTAARASLSAGIGQADVRFVTRGRENALYLEDGRVYFTFSARGYGAYQAVGSFDPSRFDVRLEGVILFDLGDGKLRNDLAAHLFYDDVAEEWRAYVSNFSTGTDGLKGRAEGGLNVAWSKICPLHGLRVMRAASLGLSGMNEDPSVTWDPDARKWRLLVSAFPRATDKPRCIRAMMLESDDWKGPFVPLTDRVSHDSTGTTIQLMSGRRYCFSGSAERRLFVYSYPDLRELGSLGVDLPPWNETCANGRVWPCFGELPEGYPYRYVLLTMDRANYPGMPTPNWTYGGLILYGAN